MSEVYAIYTAFTEISFAAYLIWYAAYDYKFMPHPFFIVRLISAVNKIINTNAVLVFLLLTAIYNFSPDNVKLEFTKNYAADLTGLTVKMILLTNTLILITKIICRSIERKSKYSVNKRGATKSDEKESN